VGYVGYDCVRYFEPRVAPLVEAQPVALGVPEALFMLIDTMVVFDHVRHTIKVVAHARLPGAQGDATALAAAYAAACAEIDALQLQLAAPVPPMQLLAAPGLQSPQRAGSSSEGSAAAARASRSYPAAPPSPRPSAAPAAAAAAAATAPPPQPAAFAWEAHSNLGREGYEDIVRTLQGHIVDGDIIQAVASQRISRPLPPGSTVTALDMYRQLRLLNPSPYMFYLECGEGFTVRWE
jgi:anthranilate synthase component 1